MRCKKFNQHTSGDLPTVDNPTWSNSPSADYPAHYLSSV
ncbi:MAG: hypothetical protein OFPI_35120 [Osedax symbiont Rs2]|nr:MAG: hypothetical protein OFPI_35120 [Osedax symbiont Rs2]